ncbi:MAG: cobyric acid synthase [Desulfovibrionaceae bacterium]|nr:cobyric acid synthase [Desulfovibrionaceae bacterium]
MKPDAHGGDRRRMAATAGRDPSDLLDFSVNIRPEGPPEFLRAALLRASADLTAYPSPHAEEALDAAARRHGLPASRFAFGNGSNELIHALARALKKRGTSTAIILEPAFSEYALACGLAGLDTRRIQDCLPRPAREAKEATAEEKSEGACFPLDELRHAPAGSAVFFANPGNPSGLLRTAEECLALLAARPDLLWIVDEAFIEYAGPEDACSILRRLPANGVVLRSLTKFHALPGVRVGYLAAPDELAEAVRAEIPAWSVNAFALSAAVAALDDRSDFADRARADNAGRRADLLAALNAVPGVRALPSAASYVLFRWPDAPPDLYGALLRRFGIAVRDCSNYRGLEDGTWFRAAVRFPDEHRALADALRALGEEGGRGSAVRLRRGPRPTPALMLQGTSSNAGKSILAAAFCRILRQDGYHTAPFKAQNMSLNSGVTADGNEMGRAQIVQAQAACVEPDARMNPILLKPHSDTGSQVILLGRPLGHMPAREYFQKKKELWQAVSGAYDSLAAEHDIMVLEGAGSPAEINLKAHDLVNMRMAAHARASVLLVGDIDRGGVYASFLGTWLSFTDAERRLLTGYIVNRFRGDASLLAPAHDAMLAQTGVPVLGVIPYIRDLAIPEEDMAGFSWSRSGDGGPKPPGCLDVAVIMPRHVSNYTDFAPLAAEPGVRLRPVRGPEEWGDPDVIMLPGSKSVVADLDELRRSGLAERIVAHARAGRWIFGICAGLQIMGRSILDPSGLESSQADVPGLGLMDLRSSFAAGKTLVRVDRAETPLGVSASGYEIHHGVTEHGPSALPRFLRCGPAWTDPADRVCGYVTGRLWATYLHGVFDDDGFRRAWLDHVRADLGLPPQKTGLVSHDLEKALNRLADLVREHSDMTAIYRSMGLA